MAIGELTSEEFRSFQELIYRSTGIRVPETKRSLLSSRISKRVQATDNDGYHSYLRHLTAHADGLEFRRFVDAVTTNETFFFRTDTHFDWFRTQFIPTLAAQAKRGHRDMSLSVWSAACSTGEEPWSLAICLAENSLRLRNWKQSVLGTDISSAAVERARAGIYGTRTMEGVTEKQRRRYFVPLEDQSRWQVRPEIRKLVSFREHNLMHPLISQDGASQAFDCIFLRNVLIYFDKPSKEQVLTHILKRLRPGGFLVVGPTEGVYGMLDQLKKISPFLYQKCDS